MAEREEYPEKKWGKIKDEFDRERIREIIKRDAMITREVEAGDIIPISKRAYLVMTVVSLICVIISIILIVGYC